MCELSAENAEWKPTPDRFSIAEVLAHLSHSEGHCYRMRLDRFVAEERPEFEPDDARMYLDLYRNRDAEDEFAHFEEQRETNIEYLRSLPADSGQRRALHREAGEITLAQMLTNGPCTIWDTCARSRSWCVQSSMSTAQGGWASRINSNHDHETYRILSLEPNRVAGKHELMDAVWDYVRAFDSKKTT